ncbi:Ferredoxin-like domain in Api92-like protein [compost metagenome]
MHAMDFARERWGTKWNACDQKVDLEECRARMETAWSFPEPILLKVSEQFPDATIEVRYADEDIGSNCGSVTFLGGKAIVRDEATRWADMSEAEQKKWAAFAYEVKGWEPDTDDE